MNDRQAKQIKLLLVITWFLMLGIVLLVLFAYVSSDSKGVVGSRGPTGPAAVVDYQKIESYVDTKFDQLPVPKDGKDGTNGHDGQNGIHGKDGYTPVKGVDYFDGTNGINGADPQMQCNVETKLLEWKLVTEEFWTDLPVRCGDL